MIRDTIIKTITDALGELGVPETMVKVEIDHPTDPTFGDYSTNVALSLFKSLGATSKSPFALAQNIAEKINDALKDLKESPIEKVQAVPPGFINFYLSRDFFTDSLQTVFENPAWYGKNSKLWNKKIIVEYTDPNPFKQFHIGHLMSNAIGESLSRILEFQGAKMTRATYGGDVGLHVAKTIWGVFKLKDEFPTDGTEHDQIVFLGKAYVTGSTAYEDDKKAAEEIKSFNKKIFEKSDPDINKTYAWGRELSIKHFQEIYVKLGSRFDYNFWESEVADEGMKIVADGLARNIFEKSEGAVIFPGEKYGLHNRVFVTSQGLPTYEAKELGLTKKKFELHDFNESIIITANEQDDYYKVIVKALEKIYPEIATRTKHMSHGMMRFTSGKMSSRKGNIVTGESMIEDAEAMVQEKMADRDITKLEKEEIATQVAVAAIKYSILRQTIGKDIIYDPEKSLSFEGDSGPYLQYSYVRAQSILAKAEEAGIKTTLDVKQIPPISVAEKMLYQFPEIVERASNDFSPNYIATYLIDLAGAFNSYYAQNKIVDKSDKSSSYKVALTEAVAITLKNGMYLLGIQAPLKM